jgi:molybdopterin converting factor small subunit
MRILVTLYSEFKQFAPGGTGSFDLDLPPGADLGHCFEHLNIPENSEYTALVNGRRADRNTPLNEGDTLVVFPLICGG